MLQREQVFQRAHRKRGLVLGGLGKDGQSNENLKREDTDVRRKGRAGINYRTKEREALLVYLSVCSTSADNLCKS